MKIEGIEAAIGRAFEQIGEANVQDSLAHANGVVHVGEGIELKAHRGRGSTWPELPVTALKDVAEIRPQDLINVSRLRIGPS